MYKSYFLPLLVCLFLATLSGCLEDKSVFPSQEVAKQKALDLSQETEETSAEFRGMFLEIMGIETAKLPEAQQAAVLKTLKNNLSVEQIDGIRDAVRQSAEQQLVAGQSQAMSMMRKGAPISGQASDAAMSDQYGYRIASKDDEVVVGAPGAGKVYVNSYVGETLTETQVLTPSNGAAGFGESVAVGGFSLLVSASTIYGGDIFVFQKQGGLWVETQIIHKEGGFDFGRVLELNANYFMTGFRDTTAGTSAAALIYRIDDNTGIWAEHQNVAVTTVIWDADFFDKRLVIGSTFGGFTTAFEVIERSGTTWTNTGAVPIFGAFGPRSVATHGNRIVVNGLAPFEKAYVYKQSGGAWLLEDELTIPGPVPFAQTRWLDMQGNRVIMSVPAYGGGDAVYEFMRSGSSWNMVATHTPDASDDQMHFGEGIKIIGDDILVGAPGGGQQFDPTPKPAGKLYIY